MEKELFLKALGLAHPWYIKDFSLDVEKERMDIFLDFEVGSKFMNADGDMVTAEQTENKVWKHLYFWQYPTYLHARVPKLKDTNGKVQMIELPWAREESGFTLLFESMILELARHIPLSRLGKQVGEEDKRLMRIISYYVGKSKELADYSTLSRL
jgi:transposase